MEMFNVKQRRLFLSDASKIKSSPTTSEAYSTFLQFLVMLFAVVRCHNYDDDTTLVYSRLESARFHFDSHFIGEKCM